MVFCHYVNAETSTSALQCILEIKNSHTLVSTLYMDSLDSINVKMYLNYGEPL